MIDFDDLEALEDRDEKLPHTPLFLVVQKFNVVRTAPSLTATALGTKFQGDCVAALARRGHWLRTAEGEQDTETWMLEVGDPVGSPGERLLKPAPTTALGCLRIGLRLAGTQSLVKHHLFQLSGRQLSRSPACGPVHLGALAPGLEATHSPVKGCPPSAAPASSVWSDREWRVFTMRRFSKGELVERCELIPLRTEMAFMQRGRELAPFDLALFWQQRHPDHPPLAVFPSGYVLLYRVVPSSHDGVTLNAFWSADGSALLLKAPRDLEVGVELCLPPRLRDVLQCGCLGLRSGPPDPSRATQPAAATAAGHAAPEAAKADAGAGFRSAILRADSFLRAGFVRSGPSPTHGRGVFALGSFARNSTVEICPTLELDEVGHLALLDFVMKFRTGNEEKIVAPLGNGMLYNHSDKPNVRWRCVPGIGGGLVVMTALRDIKEGEELFISYGDKYWSMERHGSQSGIRPDDEAPACPYHIAGDWNSFAPTAMEAFGEGLWRYTLTLGQSGQARFQILFRGAWETAIYPSVNDANPFVPHELLGPDAGGHGLNWTIGKHPKDPGRPGALYDIVLSVDARAAAADVAWHRCLDGVPGRWA